MAAAVTALAFVLRLGFVLRSAGGLRGSFNYDPGVYYSSAAALVHGRLPYADYTLLHPPGITLVLAPFAALGTVTTDHTGFIAAVLAFELLGAASAGLVVLAATRFGLPRRAAVLGGVFYAVWFGAIEAEIGPRLEPLSSAAFAAAIVALAGRSRRSLLLGGAALAFAVSVKIWWIVPAAVLLAFRLPGREQRRGLPVVLAGSAICAAVVDGPFFLAAPRQMIRSIVIYQLGRAEGALPSKRVSLLSGLGTVFPGWSTGALVAGSAALFLLVAVVAARAWQVPAARPVVAVLVAQALVLVLSPSYFSYYDGYPAVALSLVVAGAAAAPGRRAALRAVPGALVAAVAAITAIGLARPVQLVSPFPATGRLASAARHVRCVTSDLPMALIELNVLSRDLSAGCPNWVDVNGRSFGVREAQTNAPPRNRDRAWQRTLMRYLLSGGATLVYRPSQLSKRSRTQLAQLPVIASSGRLALRAIPRRVDGIRATRADFPRACQTAPHGGYCSPS